LEEDKAASRASAAAERTKAFQKRKFNPSTKVTPPSYPAHTFTRGTDRKPEKSSKETGRTSLKAKGKRLSLRAKLAEPPVDGGAKTKPAPKRPTKPKRVTSRSAAAAEVSRSLPFQEGPAPLPPRPILPGQTSRGADIARRAIRGGTLPERPFEGNFFRVRGRGDAAPHGLTRATLPTDREGYVALSQKLKGMGVYVRVNSGSQLKNIRANFIKKLGL
jgi:hypothetical protein